jgi:hypothetical protein
MTFTHRSVNVFAGMTAALVVGAACTALPIPTIAMRCDTPTFSFMTITFIKRRMMTSSGKSNADRANPDDNEDQPPEIEIENSKHG